MSANSKLRRVVMLVALSLTIGCSEPQPAPPAESDAPQPDEREAPEGDVPEPLGLIASGGVLAEMGERLPWARCDQARRLALSLRRL